MLLLAIMCCDDLFIDNAIFGVANSYKSDSIATFCQGNLKLIHIQASKSKCQFIYFSQNLNFMLSAFTKTYNLGLII